MVDSLFDVVEMIRASGNWRVIVQNNWALVLLATALVWGGRPERLAIITWWIVITTNSYLFYFLEQQGVMVRAIWLSVNWAFVFGDLLLLIGFVTLAVCANRQYLLWVAGLQIIPALAPVVRAINDDITAFVYALLTIGPGWLQIAVLTAGLIAYMRREKGVYADWRWQVARPAPAQP